MSAFPSSNRVPTSHAVSGVRALAAELGRVRNLIPLRRLNDDDFTRLVEHASVEHRRANMALFRAGIDDQWIFYLLDGEIEISDDAGHSFCLRGGSIETTHPLSTHPQARVLARARSDICYVRMPAALMRLTTRPNQAQGLEVEELHEGSATVDKQLLFTVSHALLDGSFTLPALPDIALRIRAIAADHSKGINDLVRLAQTDAVIAASCVKVANSAAYGAGTAADGLHDAIMRMGVVATRDLITAFALKDLYTSIDASTRNLMRTAWRHSSRIAALSYVLAKYSGQINAEQALLAGLVHDIGMLVLFREWPKHTSNALDYASLSALEQELNGAVGSMVLRAWHFPESIVNTALGSEQWARSSHGPLDLNDCVVLAHVHDHAPPAWSHAAPPIDETAAYAKLSNGALSPRRRLVVIDEAERELRAVHALLHT